MRKLLPVLFVILSFSVFAQNPNWNINLTLNATPSSFLSEWEQSASTSSIMVNYTGTDPAEYRVSVSIRNSKGKEILLGKSPLSGFSGPNSQMITGTEFINWSDLKYDNETYTKIIRTNRFPEGAYTEQVKVFTTNGVTLAEANGNFTIVYPDAANLLDPANAGTVSSQYPLFTWTRVNLPASINPVYNLKIVEKYAGQSATKALSANPTHYTTDITAGFSFSYPPDALPFQSGKEYVWRIRVLDQSGNPLTGNDGNSEFWTFTYNDPSGTTSPTQYTQVDLVPNIAWFTNFAGLQMTQGANTITYNGTTTLSVRLSDGATKDITATLDNLTFRKGQYAPFSFVSGKVTASIPAGTFSSSLIGNIFIPQTIEFSTTGGLVMKGNAKMPNSTTNIASEVRINASGELSGSIAMAGSLTAPLYTFGTSVAKLILTKAKLTFPGGDLKIDGQLQVLNGKVLKEFTELSFNPQGTIGGDFTTSSPITLPLMQNNTFTGKLVLQSATGNISFTPATQQGSINVNFTTQFNLAMTNGFNATLSMTSKIENGAFSIDNASVSTSTGSSDMTLNFNWFKLRLSNLNLGNLSFANDNWSFRIGTDVTFVFNGLRNLTIGPLQNLAITQDGINLPDLNNVPFTMAAGAGPSMTIGGVQIELKSLSMSRVNLSDLSNFAPNMRIALKMRLPNMPAGTSGELDNYSLDLTAVGGPSGLTITVPDQNFTNAEIPLFGGVKFKVNQFGGSVATAINGGSVDFTPAFKLKGSLKMPSGFMGCTDAQLMNLGNTLLTMNGFGKISGSITNFVPSCSLKIGSFPLTVRNTSLDFSFEDEGQKLKFGGQASLDLSSLTGGPAAANLNLSYDLLNNEFLTLDGGISGQVNVNLPKESPIFKLAITGLVINKEGIKLNGRSTAAFGTGGSVGVTIDNATFSFNTGSISAGRITFDNGFGLLVNLAGGNSTPAFSVVKNENVFPEQNGLRIALPNTLSYDKNGLTVSGTGSANLKYGGNNYSIGANFQGFKALLSPLGIQDGEIRFSLNNSVVGSLTKNGFTPDINALLANLLPDKLPIPKVDLAYIKLRENGNFLVNYSTQGDNITISTKPNAPVSAVFPGLKLGSGVVPELLVNFSVTVNKSDFSLVSGNITAVVPNDKLEMFDLSKRGIPFKLKRFTYSNDGENNKLSFGAVMNAFKEDLASENVFLTIKDDGYLRSSFNITGINKTIPLRSGANGDKVVLLLNSAVGSVTTNITDFVVPDFNIVFNGGIKIKTGAAATSKYVGATANFRLNNDGLETSNFVVENLASVPAFEMGKISLELKGIRVPLFRFSNEGWDFRVEVDAKMNFNLNGTKFSLPQINNIVFDNEGILLPQIQMNNLERTVPALTVQGVQLAIRNFRANRFRINVIDPASINWDNFGFGVDFTVAFPNFPASFPPQLKDLKAYINNAGFSNGNITGNIEKITFPGTPLKIPFGSGGAAFLVTSLGGSLGSDISVTVAGKMQLPDNLRCDDGNATTTINPNTVIKLSSTGLISGVVEGFAPSCPIKIGKAKLTVTQSRLEFSTANNNQGIKLSGSANLILALNETKNLTGRGSLSIDLLNGAISDGSVSVDTFTIGLPFNKPVFYFSTSTPSVYNADGLKFNGSAKLNVGAGKVAVNFNNFVLNSDFGYRSGTINITSSFGLHVVSNEAGLNWSVKGADYTLTDKNAVLLTMPSGITIGDDKLSFANAANSTLKLRYNNKDEGSLTLKFINNCEISYSSFSVTRGKMEFFRNTDRVGWIDNTGFNVDNILAVINIPEKFPLGSLDNAYLVLKRGTETLIATEKVATGYALKTKPNQKIKLVVPALKGTATTAPEFDIAFDIVANTDLNNLVSGSLNVSAAAGQSLIDLSDKGVPVRVTQIGFAAGPNGYELTAAGAVALPKAMGNDTIKIDRLTFANGKLSGSVSMGTYNENLAATPVYRKILNAGSMGNFKLEGVNFTFGDNMTFKFSGDIKSKFFKNGNDTTRIHFTAKYLNNKFAFTLAPDPKGIDFSKFNMKPVKGSNRPFLALAFTEDNFNLTVNTLVTAPTLSKDFELTVEGLNISKDNVVFPTVSVQTGREQKFKIFKAELTLKDVTIAGVQNKGISFSYLNDVFTVGFSGDLKFMGKTVQFGGLKIGSNGSISLANANLIDPKNPLVIVTDRVWLNTLAVSAESDNYYLTVKGDVQLPKPSPNTKKQQFTVKVGTDGSVTGGATVNIIDEQLKLDNNEAVDNTEFDLKLGKFDVQHLGLKLDFDDYRKSKLFAVATFYMKNHKNEAGKEKYIRLGSKNGSTIVDGFSVDFEGRTTWGPLSVAGLTDVEYGNFKLVMNPAPTISDEGDGIFKLTLGGTASVNFSAVGGSLTFQGLGINSNGEFSGVSTMITGGSLDVKNVVSITVTKFSMSSDPSTIKVRGLKGPSDITESDLSVLDYLRFGGTVTVGPMTGGVDDFLVYTNTDGNKNLVIKNLNCNFKQKVKLKADLLYITQGANFTIRFSATGSFGDKEIAAVGKLGRKNDKFSFGIFVAVTAGLNINIGPVQISGLGGGVFINPEQADVDAVKTACGLDDNPSAKGKVKVEGAAFVVLLYAKMSIGTNGLVDGKILLTISDVAFGLDGNATLLKRDKEIKGQFSITVGLQNPYAEGSFSIQFKIAPVVNGTGSLECWFYGPDNWGVTGQMDFNVITIYKGNGEFYTGNKGFYGSFTIQVDANVFIVSLNAGMTVKAWYRPGGDFGAYFKVWISASVLGGIASCSGELKGVLMTQPEFVLAGSASLKVKLIFVSWSGAISVKIKDKLTAKFGRDEEVEKLCADAENMGKDFAALAKSAKASMAAKPLPSLGISEVTLNAAAKELYRIIEKARLTGQDGLTDAERTAFEAFCNAEVNQTSKSPRNAASAATFNNYIGLYKNAVLGKDLDAVRATLKSKITSLDSKIQEYNRSITDLSNQLVDFTATITIPTAVQSEVNDPVQSASFAKPRTRDSIPLPGSGPSFNLNDGMITTNSSTMTTFTTAADKYEAIMVGNIAEIKKAITAFDNNFKGGSNKFITIGNKYAELYEEMNATYSLMSKIYFDDYAKTKDFIAQINAWNETTFVNAEEHRFYEFSNNLLKARTLPRWKKLQELAGESTSDATFNSLWDPNPSDQQIKANKDYLVKLYLTMPKKAFGDYAVTIPTKLPEVFAKYRQKFAPVNELQASYTGLLDPLFAKRKEMSDNLVKLLDQFIAWKEKRTAEEQLIAPSLTSLRNDKNDLVTRLRAPVVTLGTINSVNNKYATRISLNWSATHPDGIVDYAFSLNGKQYAQAQGPLDFTDNLNSVGTRTSIGIDVIPQQAGVYNNNLVVSVRARSVSGITSTQTQTFAATFGFDPANYNAPVVPTPVIPVPDRTPPEGLSVSLNESEMMDDGSEAAGTLGRYSKRSLAKSDVTINLTASDPESDIQSYKYWIFRAAYTYSIMYKNDELTPLCKEITAKIDNPAKVLANSWLVKTGELGKVSSYMFQGVDWKTATMSSKPGYSGMVKIPDSVYVVVVQAINGAGLKTVAGSYQVLFALVPPPPTVSFITEWVPVQYQKLTEFRTYKPADRPGGTTNFVAVTTAPVTTKPAATTGSDSVAISFPIKWVEPAVTVENIAYRVLSNGQEIIPWRVIRKSAAIEGASFGGQITVNVPSSYVRDTAASKLRMEAKYIQRGNQEGPVTTGSKFYFYEGGQYGNLPNRYSVSDYTPASGVSLYKSAGSLYLFAGPQKLAAFSSFNYNLRIKGYVYTIGSRAFTLPPGGSDQSTPFAISRMVPAGESLEITRAMLTQAGVGANDSQFDIYVAAITYNNWVLNRFYYFIVNNTEVKK